MPVPANTPIFFLEGEIYRPLGGHYATYVTKFPNCVAIGEDTDVWDCISRLPETNLCEQFEIAKTDSGVISYLDMQQFLSVNFTEVKYELVEVEFLNYEFKET